MIDLQAFHEDICEGYAMSTLYVTAVIVSSCDSHRVTNGTPWWLGGLLGPNSDLDLCSPEEILLGWI